MAPGSRGDNARIAGPSATEITYIGAWIARVLGPKNPAIPAFINIGQRLEGIGESEELKAFTTAGFFGSVLVPSSAASNFASCP